MKLPTYAELEVIGGLTLAAVAILYLLFGMSFSESFITVISIAITVALFNLGGGGSSGGR